MRERALRAETKPSLPPPLPPIPPLSHPQHITGPTLEKITCLNALIGGDKGAFILKSSESVAGED